MFYNGGSTEDTESPKNEKKNLLCFKMRLFFKNSARFKKQLPGGLIDKTRKRTDTVHDER